MLAAASGVVEVDCTTTAVVGEDSAAAEVVTGTAVVDACVSIEVVSTAAEELATTTSLVEATAVSIALLVVATAASVEEVSASVVDPAVDRALMGTAALVVNEDPLVPSETLCLLNRSMS